MRNERWDLICECDPQKLGSLISYLFSNEYLYIQPRFRKILLDDRKGYVHVDALLKEELLNSFFQLNSIKAELRASSLQYVVGHFCSELIFRNNRVRRVTPFKSQVFQQIKPVCIERLQSAMTISDVRDHLGETAFSSVEYFDPKAEDQFYYVYAPDYRQKLKEDSPLPFRVMGYQKLCEQRERESRYWEQQEKRFYMGINIEDRAQRQNRHQYAKEEYRSRYREHLRQKFNEMDEDDLQMPEQRGPSPPSRNFIKMALKPNTELNSNLSSFILSMQNRLDEQ